jgi:hypothetical protein
MIRFPHATVPEIQQWLDNEGYVRENDYRWFGIDYNGAVFESADPVLQTMMLLKFKNKEKL